MLTRFLVQNGSAARIWQCLSLHPTFDTTFAKQLDQQLPWLLGAPRNRLLAWRDWQALRTVYGWTPARAFDTLIIYGRDLSGQAMTTKPLLGAAWRAWSEMRLQLQFAIHVGDITTVLSPCLVLERADLLPHGCAYYRDVVGIPVPGMMYMAMYTSASRYLTEPRINLVLAYVDLAIQRPDLADVREVTDSVLWHMAPTLGDAILQRVIRSRLGHDRPIVMYGSVLRAVLRDLHRFPGGCERLANTLATIMQHRARWTLLITGGRLRAGVELPEGMMRVENEAAEAYVQRWSAWMSQFY